MHVCKRAELPGRLPEELKASGPVAVSAERVVLTGETVVDPVTLRLIEERHTRAERARDSVAHRLLETCGSNVSVRASNVPFVRLARLLRLERDDAGERVPAEESSLLSAKNFDSLDVPDGHPLEHRILDDLFVVD